MKFYQKAILLSLLLHFFLLALMLVSPSHQAKQFVLKKALIKPDNIQQKIISASTIDSTAIEHAVSKIKEQQRQKQIAEQNRQRELEKVAEQARRSRLAEEQKLAKLKKQKRAMLRQQKKLKQQRLKEKALLLKGQKKLQDLKEALEKERFLEQQRKAKALAEKKARIARKKEQKRLAELKRRQEQEKKAQQEAERKAKEEERKAKALAEQKAQQQRINAEVDRYKALIINAISQNWILPSGVDTSLSCRFEIQLAPSGEVQSVKLLKSSGDPVLDRSARTAIYQASPLPVPNTPAAFEIFKVVSLTVKPEKDL